MAGNKKPGRKQRVRRVTHALDSMAVLMGRRKAAILARQRQAGIVLSAVECGAIVRGLEQSVDAIAAGAGLPAHYENLMAATYISTILVKAGIGRRHKPACRDALEALARMNERLLESARLEFAAGELEVVRVVCQIHGEQIEVARKDQIGAALAEFRRSVREICEEDDAEDRPA